MAEANLLTVSVIAIVIVFVLLLILASIIKLITYLFPAHIEKETDYSVYASIYTTYAINYPNMKITKIEEVL